MPRGKGRTGLYSGGSSNGSRTNPTQNLTNPENGNQLNDTRNAAANYKDASYNAANEVLNPIIPALTISQANNGLQDAAYREDRHHIKIRNGL